MAVAERFGHTLAPSRRERYLSLAVEAYEMAVRAPDEPKRVAYLKVARDWLALVEKCGGVANPTAPARAQPYASHGTLDGSDL